MAYTPPIPTVLNTTDFAASGRYSTGVTGSGAVSYAGNGALITTGASGTSYALVRYALDGQAANDGIGQPFTVTMRIAQNSRGTDLKAFFGFGQPTVSGTVLTMTDKHIGFKITRASSGTCSLFATQGDGSTENASAALATIATGDVIDLAFRVNGTTSVDYYWRQNYGAWSALTTLGANLPANTGGVGATLQATVTNIGVASATSYQVQSFTYQA